MIKICNEQIQTYLKQMKKQREQKKKKEYQQRSRKFNKDIK